MWLTNYRAVAIGLALALSPACADPSPSRPPTDLSELRRIASSSPATDLEDAIARSDLRFVGVYGFTVEVLGVPDWDAGSYGLRMIPGTSDATESQEHYRLNQQARQYALEYNLLLLKHPIVSFEPNDVGVTPIQLAVPLGRIILVRKNSEHCVIKFIQFWTGKTEEDYFANYESYYQGDKSGNFSKKNVQVRKEELSSPKPWGIGRFAFSFGNRDVLCGDIKLGWSSKGWISFYGSDQREGDYGIELAPTQWTDVSQVDVFDPRVDWYRYNPKRKRINIPIDKLWGDTEENGGQ